MKHRETFRHEKYEDKIGIRHVLRLIERKNNPFIHTQLENNIPYKIVDYNQNINRVVSHVYHIDYYNIEILHHNDGNKCDEDKRNLYNVFLCVVDRKFFHKKNLDKKNAI